jgi:hypothetical protein
MHSVNVGAVVVLPLGGSARRREGWFQGFARSLPGLRRFII